MSWHYQNLFPFGPSANSIWRNFGGRRTIKSKQYREWEKSVEAFRIASETFSGEVMAVYSFGRPNKRRMDVANREKAVSDILTKWQVIGDDSQLVDLRLRWAPPEEVPPGMVRVQLYQIENPL